MLQYPKLFLFKIPGQFRGPLELPDGGEVCPGEARSWTRGTWLSAGGRMYASLSAHRDCTSDMPVALAPCQTVTNWHSAAETAASAQWQLAAHRVSRRLTLRRGGLASPRTPRPPAYSSCVAAVGPSPPANAALSSGAAFGSPNLARPREVPGRHDLCRVRGRHAGTSSAGEGIEFP